MSIPVVRNFSRLIFVCVLILSGFTFVEPSYAAVPRAPSRPIFSNIGATSVTIRWGTVAGTTFYTLERALASDPSNFEFIASDLVTTYEDAALQPATAYVYRVFAANDEGEGPPSVVSSMTTQAARQPGSPGKPTFSGIGANAVTVRWAAGKYVSSYRLERTDDFDPEFFIEATTTSPSTLSFRDTDLASSTIYYYRVVSINEFGETNSPTSSVVTPPFPPAVPGAMTVLSTTLHSASVRWGAASNNILFYRLERSTNSTNPDDFDEIATTTAITYTDSALSSSTNYYYRVRATNAVADGPYTAIVKATTQTPTPTLAPSRITFSNVGPTTVTVGWGSATGASFYLLERALTSLANFTQIATSTATTTIFADSGLSPTTSYAYRVRTLNDAGYSSYSSSSAVTTLTPNYPGMPGPISFSQVRSNSLTLAWSGAKSALYYKIERTKGDATGIFLEIATTTVMSYTDEDDVDANTAYSYRIRATNLSGDGPYGAIVQATTGSGVLYDAVGYFISPVFDTGGLKGGFRTISWEGVQPAKTRVKFQFAGSNRSTGSTFFSALNPTTKTCDPNYAYSFVAPDRPIVINSACHKDKRYLRVKMILETDEEEVSPRVDRVRLSK